MAEHGEPLSKREIEVLELVATGATNRQIAQELVVSPNTVKVHLRNIFVKLGVESRTEATLIGIRDGLIDVPESGEDEESQSPPEAEEAAAKEGQGHESEIETRAEVPPPLPWPKRLALIASILLVTLVSIATWPRADTVAERSGGDDMDNQVNGGNSVGVMSDSTGWRALAPMTIARSRFALVATPDGKLYAIGGETNGGPTGALESYDPSTDQWTPLGASKPTRVQNMSAGFIDGWIYVPGGLTPDSEPTAVVEAYNPNDEVWKEVAQLPRPLSGYALAVNDDRLYLFGGKDIRGYVNTTYIYDPQEDRWSAGKEMPTRRAYAGAAALGPRIFVMGGYDGQREYPTCEMYDLEENSWESCEPLTIGRGGLGLAGVANQLFVVGGGWQEYFWFNEKHNPTTGEWWAFETPVSRQWRNLAVASVLDRFYVAGGWNGDYLNGVWEYEVLWHKIHIPFSP